MIANYPLTVLGIMPTNNALMAIDVATSTPQTRSQIVRWGTLHAVRTICGLLATIAFLSDACHTATIRGEEQEAIARPGNPISIKSTNLVDK